MPHLIWGIIVVILLFGSDVKVGIEASKQRIRETTRVIKEALPPRVVKPALPTTRQAKNDATDAIWKLYSKTGTGTAFVVGRTLSGKNLLVTAAHCLKGGDSGYELGGGEFGEHIRFKKVRVLGRDEANDVALLIAPALTPYRPITVSQWRSGVEGEEVTMAGYGNGVWSQHTTVLTEARRLDPRVLGIEGLTPETWITEQVAEPGHSGSPVIDNEERLVGVVCAAGGGVSVIVHARYVRWLLEEFGHADIVDNRVPMDEAETNLEDELEGEPHDD